MEYTKASFEPTIGDSYNHGWKSLWKKFLELFLGGLIILLFAIPINILSIWIDDYSFTGAIGFYILFSLGYSIFILQPLQYGMFYMYLKAVRNEKVEISDLFAAKENYMNVVLASILVNFIIVIGIFLLIIPGIVFACKLAFVPYLVIDKKMDAIEAMKKSWDMTEGYAMNIFAMGILAIFISIGGLIAFVVGVIIAAMWIYASFASIYYSVDSLQGIDSEILID